MLDSLFDFIKQYIRLNFGRSRYLRAEREFSRVVHKLKPGDVAIDCGANIGSVALRLAKTGATVFAFEPDPIAFDQLRTVSERFANLTIYQKAVADRSGLVQLFRGKNFLSDPLNQTVSSSILKEKSNVDESNAVYVEQVDLLAFINEIGKPVKLLKLDVEGSEVCILEALFDSPIVDRIDRMFVETHTRTFPHFSKRYESIREVVAERFSKKINLDWK